MPAVLQGYVCYDAELLWSIITGKLLASKYTPEQFGLITYIAFQYSKWYPYDDPIWIVEY